MADFCCNDDFNLNGIFDSFDGLLYDVFITTCLKNGTCPQTTQELLDAYDDEVQSGAKPPLSGGVDHLPSLTEKDCCPGPKESKLCVSGMPAGKEHYNGTYYYYENPFQGPNNIHWLHEDEPRFWSEVTSPSGARVNAANGVRHIQANGAFAKEDRWRIGEHSWGGFVTVAESAPHADFTGARPSTISIYPWCVDWSAHGITVEQDECPSICAEEICISGLTDAQSVGWDANGTYTTESVTNGRPDYRLKPAQESFINWSGTRWEMWQLDPNWTDVADRMVLIAYDADDADVPCPELATDWVEVGGGATCAKCNVSTNWYSILVGNTSPAKNSLSAEWQKDFGGTLCYGELESGGLLKTYVAFIENETTPIGTITTTGTFKTDNTIIYETATFECYQATPQVEVGIPHEVYRFTRIKTSDLQVVADECTQCDPVICLVDNRVNPVYHYGGTFTENGTYTSNGVTAPAYEREDGGAWIWKDANCANCDPGNIEYWTVSVSKGDDAFTAPLPVSQIDTPDLSPCPSWHFDTGESMWDAPLGSSPGNPGGSDGDCIVGSCPTPTCCDAGTTPVNVNANTPNQQVAAQVTASSFSYSGKLCVGNASGGLPTNISLYVPGYNLAIGVISVMGVLDSDAIYLEVTDDPYSANGVPVMTGKCLTGTIVGNRCDLTEKT